MCTPGSRSPAQCTPGPLACGSEKIGGHEETRSIEFKTKLENEPNRLGRNEADPAEVNRNRHVKYKSGLSSTDEHSLAAWAAPIDAVLHPLISSSESSALTISLHHAIVSALQCGRHGCPVGWCGRLQSVPQTSLKIGLAAAEDLRRHPRGRDRSASAGWAGRAAARRAALGRRAACRSGATCRVRPPCRAWWQLRRRRFGGYFWRLHRRNGSKPPELQSAIVVSRCAIGGDLGREPTKFATSPSEELRGGAAIGSESYCGCQLVRVTRAQ